MDDKHEFQRTVLLVALYRHYEGIAKLLRAISHPDVPILIPLVKDKGTLNAFEIRDALVAAYRALQDTPVDHIPQGDDAQELLGTMILDWISAGEAAMEHLNDPQDWLLDTIGLALVRMEHTGHHVVDILFRAGG